jgi:transcription elongation factor Elf1
MLWLENKYVGLVSSRLDRFKRKDKNLFNFRCPFCGDSQKSNSKARGWIYEKKGKLLYFCHNCNVSMSAPKLLEKIDKSLHLEYVREMLSVKAGLIDKPKTEVEIFEDKMKPPRFIKMSELKSLKKISQLDHDHPAKQYVVSRKIPNFWHSRLFYAPKFAEFVNSIEAEKIKNVTKDEPRLIIPFINKEKNLIGFQGRSFSKDGLRYITIMIDKDSPKIFNLDLCDREKTHFIFEGPIDSMFIDNSMAMAGGHIDWNYINENTVFVYDNEPRSKHTCEKIQKVLDKGYAVSLFSNTVSEKDINDMVLSGKSPEILRTGLHSNIISGLTAQMNFNKWRRC